MENKELYQAILGLESPWYVSRVEVRKETEEIDILIALEVSSEAPLCCPECGEESPRYDRSAEQKRNKRVGSSKEQKRNKSAEQKGQAFILGLSAPQWLVSR